MNRKNAIVILVLLVVTAVVAGLYLAGREAVPEGSLAVVYQGKTQMVDPFAGGEIQVKGSMLNGKGEEKEIDASGVSLLDAIEPAGVNPEDFASLKVVSSDEFSAVLEASEVKEEGKAFLIRDKDDQGQESLRLVVFGDDNGKRQVKDVARIEIEK